MKFTIHNMIIALCCM